MMTHEPVTQGKNELPLRHLSSRCPLGAITTNTSRLNAQGNRRRYPGQKTSNPPHVSTNARITRQRAKAPVSVQSALTTQYTNEQRVGKFVFFDNYGAVRLDKKLGAGAYGCVYRATAVDNGMVYAVKVISKSSSSKEKTNRQDSQRREHQLHLAVSEHPNIVSIYATAQVGSISALLMELCEEGDLFQNIAEFSLYENRNDDARSVFLQLLDAVEYCHSKGVFHRDLKPENVLVARNGTQVRLADFGLATMNIISYDYGWGSTFYMSPECIGTVKSHAGYLCAPGDVWALGVILVNLMCGRNPWKEATVSDSRYCSFRRDPNFIRSILPVTDAFTKILSRVFEEDPIQRITLNELRSEVASCKFFTKSAQEAALIANLPVACPSPGPFYSSPLSDAYSDDTDASSVGEIDETSRYPAHLPEPSNLSVFLPPIVGTPVQQVPYTKSFDYTPQTRPDLFSGGDAEYWHEQMAFPGCLVDKPSPMSSPFAISTNEHMSPFMGSGYPIYQFTPFNTPAFIPSTPVYEPFSPGFHPHYLSHGVSNPNIAFGFNP